MLQEAATDVASAAKRTHQETILPQAVTHPRHVDVYLADPALADEPRAAAWLPLLNPAERARYERYRVEGARREYLTGRALVRASLSRYADVDPADWRFEANRYGRPSVAAEQAHLAPGLVFNLSHTRGLVALAVGRDCDLGVDVEWIDRDNELAKLCDRYFAPSEAAYARAGEGAELKERFFAFWTLKEAYIKARGMGLALPLDGFAYDITGEAPTIRFEPTCPDDPGRWRFMRRAMGPVHRLALAIASKQDEMRLRFRRVVPLEDELAIEEVVLGLDGGQAAS
ncbi:4'-phosphopantetheinyl transferase family protein [Jiella pelagia]|uniref:4'-phosphopantetheinyl transferase superfamily protein n=1 Tax=Jiella pelagia TaxID=2986949 RepID=A0ABY7BWR1_9HYPH|nr:4'-phosphopantetheinyl transferase superfamily protein [Jiella pelagia]WAP67159.1 4'-phosphopantetheinyl transferase superfamily protein [Jiella pelagia]